LAGIYIHIPYCRKACHYCDFHFSTVFKTKPLLVKAILRELKLRSSELNEPVETIYFGGGTPSILEESELHEIISSLHSHFKVDKNAEITFEANPEDISRSAIELWKSIGINRLSIGVQTFSDEILTWMNRSHSALQSETSVKMAQDLGIENISIDLIYGVHSRRLEDWKIEISQALSLDVPHISAYCLTVEEKTVFHKRLQKGEAISHADDEVEKEFFYLLSALEAQKIFMYEVSNFSKEGMLSKHNSNYWSGRPYLGIGPGAHSFNGLEVRSWNVSNNSTYIKSLNEGKRPFKSERLGLLERYNESIMTGLRKCSGLMLKDILEVFNVDLSHEFSNEIKYYTDQGLVQCSDHNLSLTREGFLLADRISSDFFK